MSASALATELAIAAASPLIKKSMKRAKRKLFGTPSKGMEGESTRTAQVPYLGEVGYGNKALSKLRNPRKNSKYLLYGSVGEDEAYGQVSHGLTTYLGMSSVKATGSGTETAAQASWSGSLKYHVAAALLRKILKKHFQMDIVSHDERVQLRLENGGTDYYPGIYFIWEQCAMEGAPNPTYGSVRVSLGTGTIVKTFGRLAYEICNTVLGAQAFGGVQGTPEYHTRKLYGYAIVTPSGAGDNEAPCLGKINRLDTAYVKGYSKAEMCIQNVSLPLNDADTSGVRLDNRIDANPLHVRVLKFKSPYPTPKHNNVQYVTNQIIDTTLDTISTGVPASTDYRDAFMYDKNGDGVVVPADAATTYSTGPWNQLPIPSLFYKCTGIGDFELAPGEIRKITLHFKYDGSLQKFITGMATTSETNSMRFPARDAMGTSILIAAESVMTSATGNQNPILNYMVSYWAGAVMKKDKRITIEPYNRTTTQTDADLITQGTYVGGDDPLLV